MKKLTGEEIQGMPFVYTGEKIPKGWKWFIEIGEIPELEFWVCEPEPECWGLMDVWVMPG